MPGSVGVFRKRATRARRFRERYRPRPITWTPILPLYSVDTTLPTGWNGAADATVSTALGLTDALAAVDQNLGRTYVIEITAGSSISGTFKIPNKTGSNWLVIRTSGYASLPATGTRVSPSDATNMAKLTNSSDVPNFWFELGAHNVRLIGIEVTNTASSVSTLSYCGYDYVGGVYASSLAQLPSYITYDRCYFHGQTTGNIVRGAEFDPTYGAIIDCYFSDFHHTGSDAQAFYAFTSPGPFKIDNNYLSATGENVMFGGADTQITNVTPSDITFTNNYCKKPLTWYLAHPSSDGTNWVIKNLFELKHAQRILIDGNVFDGCWPQGQTGYAILFTPRNQSGTNPWAVVKDVTFTNNVVRNTLSGINLLTSDNPFNGGGYSEALDRIKIENNLVLCDGTNFNLAGGGSSNLISMGAGAGIQPSHAIQIRHNTMLHLANGYAQWLLGEAPTFSSWSKYKDNIFTAGYYGVQASGLTAGTVSLDAYHTRYEYDYNLHIRDGGASNTLPSGNFSVANFSDAGFTDFAGGDYSLTNGSTYHNAASDGTDIGVDWTALQSAISGVVPAISTPIFAHHLRQQGIQ